MINEKVLATMILILRTRMRLNIYEKEGLGEFDTPRTLKARNVERNIKLNT